MILGAFDYITPPFDQSVILTMLGRVAWLLLNTTLSVTEIASRLEYKDNSYFSKLFRQRYGMAPSIYRMPLNYDFQI